MTEPNMDRERLERGCPVCGTKGRGESESRPRHFEYPCGADVWGGINADGNEFYWFHKDCPNALSVVQKLREDNERLRARVDKATLALQEFVLAAPCGTDERGWCHTHGRSRCEQDWLKDTLKELE